MDRKNRGGLSRGVGGGGAGPEFSRFVTNFRRLVPRPEI
jgi:hypothetical protein